MPRGVYNRKKFTEKLDVAPPIKDYAVKPEMPKPEVKKDLCECKHEKDAHYGGPKGWCNRGGCNCQEFK